MGSLRSSYGSKITSFEMKPLLAYIKEQDADPKKDTKKKKKKKKKLPEEE